MLDWEVCVDILSPSFCLPENRKAVNYFLKWESTELHLVCAWMWRFTRNQAICCKFINCSCWLYCWWLLPPANKWCWTDKDKSDFYFFIFGGGEGDNLGFSCGWRKIYVRVLLQSNKILWNYISRNTKPKKKKWREYFQVLAVCCNSRWLVLKLIPEFL